MTAVNAAVTRNLAADTFTVVFDDGHNTAKFYLPAATLEQLRRQIDEVLPAKGGSDGG